MPETPAAQDDDTPGQHPGHAPEQHPAAAAVLAEKVTADQDGHAPRDLAHRLQQRQPVIDLDGFIGQCRDSRAHERFRQLTAGGQVQVGEEELARAQEGVFGWQRLFDLHHQLCFFEHGRVVIHQPGAGLLVIGVQISGPSARAALDHDLMPAPDELVGRGRQQGDPELLRFDFFGNPDNHSALK